MKVFKFGGASIRNAEAVANMSKIIAASANESLVVVVSAMGKTTNALEKLLQLNAKQENFQEELNQLKDFHGEIMQKLISDRSDPVYDTVDNYFSLLVQNLENHHAAFNQKYDQVVSFGEIISSTIIAAYLNTSGVTIGWLDARQYIRTDEQFREAKIDWPETNHRIEELAGFLQKKPVITQGFIGGTVSGFTSTLGREGSDFTAAIFASALQAESLSIWKDVPGVLNADPKRLPDTVKYEELSYQEAAEMTYFGASVIHPKTIKPLADKGIPLLVRSFDYPDVPGTIIHHCEIHEPVPAIIFKPQQTLVTFKMKDLDFINEKKLSVIFHILDKLNIKINLMQNSAVSFTVCFDDYPVKLDDLLDYLSRDFNIRYNQNLLLITVKNYDQKSIDLVSENKEILVEQKTRHTYQIIVQEN